MTIHPLTALLAAAAAAAAISPAAAATLTLVGSEVSARVSVPSEDPAAVPPVVREQVVTDATGGDVGVFGEVDLLASGGDQVSFASGTMGARYREVPGAAGPDAELRFSGRSSYQSVQTGGLTFGSGDASLTFDLDAAASFEVTGEYTDTTGGASGFFLRLADAAGSTLFRAAAGGSDGPDSDGDYEPVEIRGFGVLDAGRYTVSASQGVSGGIFTGPEIRAGLSATFTFADTALVPEPAAAGLLLLFAPAVLRRRP